MCQRQQQQKQQQQQQQQHEDMQVPRDGLGRPPRQDDWILPQHERLLDLLERSTGELTGDKRAFVLEGVQHGPYAREHLELGLAHNTRQAFPPDASVRLGGGYQLYIDGKLIQHGSLWTTKSLGNRHRVHVRNCVKNSQAWNEHTGDATLDSVVDYLVQKLGEWTPRTKYYDRWHNRAAAGSGSVTIFRSSGGRQCSFCQHCDAYDLLNSLLSCEAQHGPREGWAADQLQKHLREKHRRTQNGGRFR